MGVKKTWSELISHIRHWKSSSEYLKGVSSVSAGSLSKYSPFEQSDSSLWSDDAEIFSELLSLDF